jgi:hypothetical protein
MVLYPDIHLTIKLSSLTGEHEKDRNALREMVLDELMKERPGQGKGDLTAKYRYNVEWLDSGDRVYLTRPAVLSKGFDFVIHVENHVFAHGKDNPAHEDIKADLKSKKQANPEHAAKLLSLIERVFQCEDPQDFRAEYQTLKFADGLSSEVILKVVKWFFIEQDIRFWNWSGRHMFMNAARESLS